MQKHKTALENFRLVSKQTAAKYLRRSESSVDRYRKQGILQGKKVGGRIMFLETELIRFINDSDV